MPTHKSAAKRIKTNERANERNRAIRSNVRLAIRRVRECKKKKEGEELLGHALVLIDKASQKGLYHKNNAARKKSRLCHYIGSLQ